MHRGGVGDAGTCYDVTIHPGTGTGSRAIAEEIIRQANDPHSKLRNVLLGAVSASLKSEREWVERLQATVTNLQSERDDAVR